MAKGQVREGRWDCSHCGATGILGRNKCCTQCGASRGADVKFYLPADAQVVTDASLLSLANAGPDWVCSHCNADNRGDANFCGTCGAEKGSSSSHQVKDYSFANVPRSAAAATPHFHVNDDNDVHYADSAPTSMSTRDTADYSAYQPNEDPYDPPQKKFTLPRIGLPHIGLGVLFLIIAVLGLMFLSWATFHTTEVKTHVTHFDWNRTVFIDQYRTVEEGDWSMPMGGRLERTESHINHYDKVFDHNETKHRSVRDGDEDYACGEQDDGNGFFTEKMCSRPKYKDETYDDPVYRDVPVYEPWYVYLIERWVLERTVATSGASQNPAPQWGVVTLQCANLAQIGCEHEDHREENYSVTFRDSDGKLYPMPVNFADWSQYNADSEYTLVLNAFGIRNDPLHPDKK